MGTTNCKRCSLPNPVEYRFCGSCGRELPRQVAKVVSSWSTTAIKNINRSNKNSGRRIFG